jgi:hypothetical protein
LKGGLFVRTLAVLQKGGRVDTESRLIKYISSKEGVKWVKIEDICDDFKSKIKPEAGTLLPAELGAILKDSGMY